MNAAEKTIRWLRRDQLNVDDEWSVTLPNGFTWWADKNPQHIEVVGSEPGPDNEMGYFIRVKTEVWKGVALKEKGLAALNGLLMSTATMGGLVHDRERKRIYLCSMVRVHEGIWQWMARLISVAAMLQIQEAHFLADQFATLLGAEPATSPHPTNGIREEPDELAVGFVRLVASQGKLPGKWSEGEFEELLQEWAQKPPALMASGGDEEITIKFPYGDDSSVCEIRGDQSHPRIGNGLLVLQRFPVPGLSETEGARHALELNYSQLNVRPDGYGFGSYCYRDDCIIFNGFLPNLAHSPGLLPNLYFSCAERARAMSIRFTTKN